MNPDENQLDSAYDIFFVRMLKFTHAKKTWFENQTFIRPTSITIEYTPLQIRIINNFHDLENSIRTAYYFSPKSSINIGINHWIQFPKEFFLYRINAATGGLYE